MLHFRQHWRWWRRCSFLAETVHEGQQARLALDVFRVEVIRKSPRRRRVSHRPWRTRAWRQQSGRQSPCRPAKAVQIKPPSFQMSRVFPGSPELEARSQPWPARAPVWTPRVGAVRPSLRPSFQRTDLSQRASGQPNGGGLFHLEGQHPCFRCANQPNLPHTGARTERRVIIDSCGPRKPMSLFEREGRAGVNQAPSGGSLRAKIGSMWRL